MTDPEMADPGTAELQLGIVMADPGTAELQLGIVMAGPGTAELQLGIRPAPISFAEALKLSAAKHRCRTRHP